MLSSRRRPRCIQLDLFHPVRKALVPQQQLPQEARENTVRLLVQLLRSGYLAQLNAEQGKEVCDE